MNLIKGGLTNFLVFRLCVHYVIRFQDDSEEK